MEEPGSGQKRPAEGPEEDLPSKAARLEPHPAAAILPDSLPGTANGVEGIQSPELSIATLQQQLADALAEGARWREECEGHRRRLEAGGVGAEAKVTGLQAELGDAKKQVDALKAAAKRDGQRIQQLELQLKQAQSDARHAQQQTQQLRMAQQHHRPNTMHPSPPPPAMPPQQHHRMPHAGPGVGGYPTPTPPGAAGGWPGQQAHYAGYGAQGQQQQQQPGVPGQQGQGAGAYYDWSAWGQQHGQQQGQQQQQQQQQQQGGDYWGAGGYQHPQAAQGAVAAQTPSAASTAQAPHHAPYYSQGAPGATGAYASPPAPGAVAAAPPAAGGSAPRAPTSADEEQIWWDLDQRKREVVERFARSYPAMVSPAEAMRLCISDFREMTEAQLESFFMWLAGNCNPSRPLKAPGGFVRVKHTEWKKLHGL